MAGKPSLLEQVRQCLRLKHYSIRTERAYVDWSKRFILFHGKRHPSEMGTDEIRHFLSHLATGRTVAAATQNQAPCSLLFLYRDVLGVELSYVEGIERAKRPGRVPVVLTRREADGILSRVGGAYRLMAGLLYGSGPRLMECLRLRVKDLDFGYRQVTFRDGKGEKDRRTVLPGSLAEPLGRHLERVRLLHEEDLRAGYGRVYLPYALERKYQNAAAEWVWQWVFPSATLSVTRQTIVQETIVDSNKGYYPVFNDVSDRLIPELQLDPYQQAVLQRLYRLSRGWKSEECEVGLGTLAKFCVMSRSQVQRSVAKLIEKGLVESLGSSKKGGKEGNRYRVLPGLKTVPRQTIANPTIVPETTVRGTIVREEETSSPENTVVSQGIVPRGTNKNSNKELKNNTHTEPGVGVGVGSKFTIEECRKYAQHLQSTGQGINNPGGYATTIHRTGEADMLIESFLRPEAPSPSSTLDTSQCPDCHGSGFYYPKGVEGGVAKCKHKQLRKEAG